MQVRVIMTAEVPDHFTEMQELYEYVWSAINQFTVIDITDEDGERIRF